MQISGEQNIIFSSNEKIYYLHIKGDFIAKNSFVPEATPISGIIDHYFIMKFFKKELGKNTLY